MCEQTVAMYCLLDNIIRFSRPADTSPVAGSRRLTDGQVLTTPLVVTRFFGGNPVIAKLSIIQLTIFSLYRGITPFLWGQLGIEKPERARRLVWAQQG
ncbi:hypothetical protein [Hymenobacter sp. UV11]|jgi:hypothetical protein|uniref:hypothetical protein n=1 Tax=Hymenobacter sp. UV11 TaxID=1849735 RepID=UPI00105C7ED7|nr:hypothetical protein [Hymenobacter sp. UV11]